MLQRVQLILKKTGLPLLFVSFAFTLALRFHLYEHEPSCPPMSNIVVWTLFNDSCRHGALEAVAGAVVESASAQQGSTRAPHCRKQTPGRPRRQLNEGGCACGIARWTATKHATMAGRMVVASGRVTRALLPLISPNPDISTGSPRFPLHRERTTHAKINVTLHVLRDVLAVESTRKIVRAHHTLCNKDAYGASLYVMNMHLVNRRKEVL